MRFILLVCAALIPATTYAEFFVDLGVNYSEIKVTLAGNDPVNTDAEAGAHAGLGVRRKATTNGDIGVRVELDSVDSKLLLAVRALDYRYKFSENIAVSAFIGGARYDLATPAYGYYYGVGVQWLDAIPGWDANLDFRIGDKVARDNTLLPDDTRGERPDDFYDIRGVSFYLSYKF